MRESKDEFVERVGRDWKENPRWNGIERRYSPEDVWKLRGTLQEFHTLALHGARKLWKLLHERPFIRTLGALTGNQAVQMVEAGLEAIYVSGWQVAADMNEAGETYPDQSLYPADSAPKLVRRINNAFMRADQISHMEGKSRDWFAPIVADGEAGFGGVLNVYEFMRAMIRAGAAGVHFEDQLSAYKKCGHLGGKVLVSTRSFIDSLVSARFSADVQGVPTILIARTDANSATLLLNDVDDRDQEFISGSRSHEGFFYFDGGLDASISRGLAFAPYADLLWFETSKPDLDEAKEFASAIHKKYPCKMLAYNCSPSFNWSKAMNPKEAEEFQNELGLLGYKFQFVTLAGFHQNNHGMFELAKKYKERGMEAYMELQNREFTAQSQGYRAIKHQSFVGTGYFDEISSIVTGGSTNTTALGGSTESEQFH